MIILWILAVVLLALCSWIVLGNLWIAFAGFFLKKRESILPFVGGIAGAIGFLLLPVSQAKHYWWVPLVIDLGCGPMLVAVLIDQVKKKLRHS
jgi:hypothetical protein